MHERFVFDYAVVRVVPRVDRGEFLNAGVIVFCPTAAFLECRIELDHSPACKRWHRRSIWQSWRAISMPSPKSAPAATTPARSAACPNEPASTGSSPRAAP